MEGGDQVDDDQLLYDSGMSEQDCADMLSDEKAQIASAIKASKEDDNLSSRSSNILNSPTKDDGCCRSSPRAMNNTPSGANTRSGAKRIGSKPQSGTATQMKDNSNSRTISPSNTNLRISEQSMDGTKKSNENGGLAKKTPISKHQEKIQNCDKETVKSPGSTSDTRVGDSPDNVEGELIPSLMQIVFEKRKSASRFPENLCPSFSLCKADWLKEASQCFLDRKVAKIRFEAQRSKWVTISERTLTLATLEKIVARSPTAKEQSPSPMESRHAGQDHMDKTKVCPERPNNLRENSPSNTMQENSAEASFSKGSSISMTSELEKFEASTTSGTSRKGNPEKSETLAENNLERKEDEVNNKTEQQGRRTRRKRNGNQRNSTKFKASGSSVSSPIHDESSKSEFDLPTSAEREPYTLNNDDYPPLNGERVNTENHTAPSLDTEMGHCPLCNKVFEVKLLDDHAWNCLRNRSTEEETKQVAAKEENGSDTDVTEVEFWRSSARIRSMKRSGGDWLSKGERPSKNLRK